MRPKSSTTVLQKVYDECYLTCSTAIYFESKGNEDEALRSWRQALQQIQSYENSSQYRRGSSSSSSAGSATEKALVDSLGSLKLQCLERIDILDALRISRQEEERDRELLRHYNGGVSPAQSPSASIYQSRDEPPPYFFLGDTDTESHLRPPHDRRPSASSITTSSNTLLGSGLPPVPSTLSKTKTRTPSPEKKGLLTTLRNAGGGSGSGSGANGKVTVKRRPLARPTGAESVAAAARAATRAWGSTNRPGGLTAGRSFPDSSSVTVNTLNTLLSQGSATKSSIDLTQPHSSSSAVSPARLSPANPPNNHGYVMSAPSRSNMLTYFPTMTPSKSSGQDVEPFPNPSHFMVPPHERTESYNPRNDYLHPINHHAHATPPDLSNLTVSSRSQGFRPASQAFSDDDSIYNPASGPSETSPPPKPPKKPYMQANKVSTSDNEFTTEKSRISYLTPRTPSNTTGRTSSQDFRWPANATSNRLTVPVQPRKSSEVDSSRRSSRSDMLSLSPENHRTSRLSSIASTSNSVPVFEMADTSESGEATIEGLANEAWEKRVKTALKSLDKGVDQAAAKQIINEIVIHGDEVHWEDIAGLDAAKLALKEAVVYPFLRPDLFSGLREPARGMLLFGPPGTGKTMLARAVATESRSTFFSISASSLTSKYLGESEKLVRALFQLAKALAPSIIFIDEIDSLLSARSGSGEHEATRRIKTEFLIQWSDLQRAAAGKEVQKSEGDATRVLVLAATNLPWAIDEAARRRFVRRQYIPLPDGPVRVKQMRNLLGQQNHTLTDWDMKQLEILTEDFSGSDITALAKDAAMGPLRSLGEALLHMRMDDIRPITLDDFKASLNSIRPSVNKDGLKQYEDWAKNFGERV